MQRELPLEHGMIHGLRDYLQSFLKFCRVQKAHSINTVSSYKCDLEDFLKFTDVFNIQTVESYISHLSSLDFKTSSLRRKLSSIRQFGDYLIYVGFFSENPVSFISVPKKELKLPKFLTENEINSLLSTAEMDQTPIGMRTNCIINLLYASGMRVSELVNLELSGIKFDGLGNEKTILNHMIISGKGKKERLVPISQRAINALTKYLVIRKTSDTNKALFPSNGRDGKLTRIKVGLDLKNLAIASGIDPIRVSPHVIRHSIATHLLSKKMDVRILQQILGHSDISTTSIYLSVLKDSVSELVNKYHPLTL